MFLEGGYVPYPPGALGSAVVGRGGTYTPLISAGRV